VMPELSVFWSPDELSCTHVIFPLCTQTLQILQSLAPLTLLPSNLLVTTKFSRPYYLLMTWPRKANRRWWILFKLFAVRSVHQNYG